MTATPNNEAAGPEVRDAAFHLRWALDVLAEHGLEEFSILVQQMHREAERYLASLTPAPSARDADGACCTMIDYFNARACEACSGRVEGHAFRTRTPASVPVAELVALVAEWELDVAEDVEANIDPVVISVQRHAIKQLSALIQKGADHE